MPKVLTRTKHYMVARRLRQYIAKNLSPGSEMTTAAELQRITGASHGTIIRALNSLSEDGILHRPAGKQRYVVRELSERPIIKLRFVRHDYPSSSSDTYIDDIYKICQKRNWKFETKTFSRLDQLDFNYITGASDAVIFLPPSEDFPEKLERSMVRAKQPIVVLMEHCELKGIGNVVVDDECCGHLAVKTLADLGHKNILLINDQPRESTIRARESGWKRGMIERFGKAPDNLIFNTGVKSFENAMLVAYKAFSEYLSQYRKHLPFSAIFTTSLPGAIAVSRVLREANIRVPEEVSLITYGGEEALCDFLYPPLTNISVDMTEYSSAAVELVEQMLKEPKKPVKRLLPVKLNVSGSTGPCK